MGDLAFDDPKREWFTVKDAIKRVRVGAECYFWYSAEGPKKSQTSKFERGWEGIPDSRALMASPVRASDLKPQRKRKPKHVVANDLLLHIEYKMDTMEYCAVITSPSTQREIVVKAHAGPHGTPLGPNVFLAYENT